mmetsp:Transcript_120796/g.210210  ORF Transcript_120796/g.210210 Transcript_120796/m.210210 type:complete len:287 (+) Transcript_120796:754-1614(+)
MVGKLIIFVRLNQGICNSGHLFLLLLPRLAFGMPWLSVCQLALGATDRLIAHVADKAFLVVAIIPNCNSVVICRLSTRRTVRVVRSRIVSGIGCWGAVGVFTDIEVAELSIFVFALSSQLILSQHSLTLFSLRVFAQDSQLTGVLSGPDQVLDVVLPVLDLQLRVVPTCADALHLIGLQLLDGLFELMGIDDLLVVPLLHLLQGNLPLSDLLIQLLPLNIELLSQHRNLLLVLHDEFLHLLVIHLGESVYLRRQGLLGVPLDLCDFICQLGNLLLQHRLLLLLLFD